MRFAALTGATKLELDGSALPNALDGQRRRSGKPDADVLIKEAANVRRLHGDRAQMMRGSLHGDEALVSWSRAHYVFPIRAHVPSAVGSV